MFLKGEKCFHFPLFQKCIKKSKCQQQKNWDWDLVFSFMYLVLVYPMDKTLDSDFVSQINVLPEKSHVFARNSNFSLFFQENHNI